MIDIKRDFEQELEERLHNWTPFLQVVSGPRQVGKTTGVKNTLGRIGLPYVYATADLPAPPDSEWLVQQWQRARALPGRRILVLDEVQKIARWSEVVKSLYDEDRRDSNLSVVVLGSASMSLAVGLDDSLLGRFEIIRVPHWLAHECRTAFNWGLTEYLKFGGYPAAATLVSNPARWQDFMRDSILEPVLSRDIANFRTINNPALFRQTLNLALSYPAQELSYAKMLGQLSERGNSATVKGYLEALSQAFLLKLLSNFSSSELKSRTSSPKLLPLAPALLHMQHDPTQLERGTDWYGRVFECAVGIRLAQLPGDLFYWREGKVDIDYVLVRSGRVLGIEVRSGAATPSRGLHSFKQRFTGARTLMVDSELAAEIIMSTKEPGIIQQLLS